MASKPLPTNVTRLPTAAPKKVVQRYNRYLRDYRSENPWPGKWAAERDIDRAMRERYPDEQDFTIERSPELLLGMSIFATLTADQKGEVLNTVKGVYQRYGGDEYRALSNMLAALSFRDREERK